MPTPTADIEDRAGLIRLISGFEGWLADAEAFKLYELARACSGRGAIVEIGSWKGRSTVCLALGARAGGCARVVAIDPHTGSLEHRAAAGAVWTFDEFRANVEAAGVADAVEAVVEPASDVAARFDEPIELLFVDGDHAYEAVAGDVELWFPKVMDGGFVAIHDAFREQDGPRRVIRERLIGACVDVGFAHSLFYGRKSADASRLRRAQARFALARQDARERLVRRRRRV